MNIQQKMPATAEEFLVWNLYREGKREFVRGKVVELMINTTRNHARLASRVLFALSSALDQNQYDCGTADFAVKTHDGVRFPDVLVDRLTPESSGSDLAARQPVVLVEVLSPSSHDRDFKEKVEDYTRLPTLNHYLIVAQDEPRAWLWSRTDGAWAEPEIISGLDAQIRLPSVGVTIDMRMLFSGIA